MPPASLPFLPAALAALLAIPAAWAAQAPSAPVPLRAVEVAPGILVIDESAAHGGSVTIIGGPDGTLLIDTGIAPLVAQVEAEALRVTGRPIRLVANTHAHVDEIGGNAQFAGIGALLIGRDRVRDSILKPRAHADASDQRTRRQARAPSPESAPSITFSTDLTLHVAGYAIRALAIADAHTDSDTIFAIGAPGAVAEVIVSGYLLRPGGFPSINRADGGTLAGMEQAKAMLLALAGPDTRIITSRGEVVGRDAVLAQQRLLGTLKNRVGALVAAGKTEDEAVAADLTRGLGIVTQPGRISAETFVRDLYAAISRKT